MNTRLRIPCKFKVKAGGHRSYPGGMRGHRCHLLADTLEGIPESAVHSDLDHAVDENATMDSEDDAENHIQKNLEASVVLVVHNHTVSSLEVHHLEVVHDLVAVAYLHDHLEASVARVASYQMKSSLVPAWKRAVHELHSCLKCFARKQSWSKA